MRPSARSIFRRSGAARSPSMKPGPRARAAAVAEAAVAEATAEAAAVGVAEAAGAGAGNVRQLKKEGAPTGAPFFYFKSPQLLSWPARPVESPNRSSLIPTRSRIDRN